ncbi:GIY-YIG nuclease family protein [Paraburkholderia xenovorans]|uniref:GIY-YIG nuclease family protein n=1 Tax=Paraburkholderia xenovorans TaxID=36873 RepID=UPI0038B9E219
MDIAVASGYVYLLINPSMPGMVKVGCTLRDSKFRARKLYTTGVPTPFEVAFEVFTEDHEKLEGELHSRLANFRVNDDREFFRYPLKDIISLVLDLSKNKNDPDSEFGAVSIFHRLKEKYNNWMDPSIADVRIVQTNERVWLEITWEKTIADYLKDQTIKRTDLAFICGDDEESNYFQRDDTVTINAKKFTEDFDAYSIMMVTDLFSDAACREIGEIFKPQWQSAEK